jgi:hypothetical protein
MPEHHAHSVDIDRGTAVYTITHVIHKQPTLLQRREK